MRDHKLHVKGNGRLFLYYDIIGISLQGFLCTQISAITCTYQDYITTHDVPNLDQYRSEPPIVPPFVVPTRLNTVTT